MITNFILYVKDQKRSASFYRELFGINPTLDVPGMTEFVLGTGCILGLMPETGIKRLLGNSIKDPEKTNGISRCELYLTVDNPSSYLGKAEKLNSPLLSALSERDWGDEAGYIMDPDGHVVAFARKARA